MSTTSPEEMSKISINKRILNEFATKILNEERISKATDARSRSKRLSEHSEMNFHCECDDRDCMELITISTEEYIQVHHKTKQFIVVASHVRLDIEEIIEHLGAYTLVEKYFPHTK